MHAKPSGMRIILGYVAMGATVISYTVYMVTMILTMFVNNPDITLRFVIEDVLYLVIVTTLIFSAMVYLVTRQGAMRRFLTHERVPRAVLDEHYAHGYDKGITVLIPSYVEQPKVVAKTIWSAALQEFPDLAVVLLIDDPPHPKNDESRQILEACRSLVPVFSTNSRDPRNGSPNIAIWPPRRSPGRCTPGAASSPDARTTTVRLCAGWMRKPTIGRSRTIPMNSSAIRCCVVWHATCDRLRTR